MPLLESPPQISVEATRDLNDAFNFFNSHMFGSELPPCMIIFHRYAKSYGYFKPKTWGKEGEKAIRDEIGISQDHLYRTDKETIATLVHEMTHCWQEHFGEPPRKCYHNKEWANKLESIGLMPSSTGAEGGKRTGQKVSHYVIPSGLYEQLFSKLEDQGYKINWRDVRAGGAGGEKGPTKPKTRFKYTCSCDVNVWAKPGVNVICGECEKPFVCEEE